MRRVKVIRRGLGEWIKTLEAETTSYREFEGLWSGEKSILSYAKGRKDVLLISDEIEAGLPQGEMGYHIRARLGLSRLPMKLGRFRRRTQRALLKDWLRAISG